MSNSKNALESAGSEEYWNLTVDGKEYLVTHNTTANPQIEEWTMLDEEHEEIGDDEELSDKLWGEFERLKKELKK